MIASVAGDVFAVLVALCITVWVIVILMVPWWLALKTWVSLRRPKG